MTIAIRYALATGLALASPWAWAATTTPACQAAAARAETQVAMLMPRLSYAVTGPGRLYFHAAPTPACRTATFVVPGDALIGYSEWHGWLSVMYTNPRTGQDTEGWVRGERLRVGGTMGPAQ